MRVVSSLPIRDAQGRPIKHPMVDPSRDPSAESSATGARGDGPRLLASNGAPVFGWVFILVWLSALGAGTVAFASRAGGEGLPRHVASLVMAGFWLAGLGAVAFLLRIPRTTVRLDGRDLVVTERWLVGRQEERIAHGQPARVEIANERDSDGDPYFVCQLTMPSGRVVKIKEGHRSEVVEATRLAVAAALGRIPDQG